MAAHNDLGRKGEEKAVEYLVREGYVVLERNWRLKHRELDVICLKGDLLVVVEVKTRDLPEEHPRGTVGLPQEKKYPYSDGCLY